MVYMLQVYALVVVVVFGLAGTILLFLVAFNHSKEYARARKAMQSIVTAPPRTRQATSGAVSQPQHVDILRAA